MTEQWQPVETATEADLPFIVWDSENGVPMVVYDHGGPLEDLKLLSDGFTHWMPSPAPPEPPK